MTQDMITPDPENFGLRSFAEILPQRDPIVGEDPGSFVGFHEGMMISLAPATPYESVVAENLIAIEWELLQHRRMRDAGIRGVIRKAIRDAVKKQHRALHNRRLDEAWDEFIAAGGDEDEWEDPFKFDDDAADAAGEDLARRAVSPDIAVHEGAYAEISELGLAPLEVMAEAYRSHKSEIVIHEQRLPPLERRRREVKRDFDQLQNSRPLKGKVIEEKVIEAEEIKE